MREAVMQAEADAGWIAHAARVRTMQAEATIHQFAYAPFDFYAKPNWRAILKLVALKHKSRVGLILSRDRTRVTIAARHEAVRLMASHCGMEAPAIARHMARDRTTVLYVLGRLKKKGPRHAH
jgi:chromosomal replication initiation ATPase DnaA